MSVLINMINATDVMTQGVSKPTRLQQFQNLKETETTGIVDGYEIDPHTAFIVCSVYEAVNERNQQELDQLSVRDLVAIAIQMVM